MLQNYNAMQTNCGFTNCTGNRPETVLPFSYCTTIKRFPTNGKNKAGFIQENVLIKYFPSAGFNSICHVSHCSSCMPPCTLKARRRSTFYRKSMNCKTGQNMDII